MLTTLKNALKIKDIRNKLLFTLGMLVVIRLGSQLPVPGVRIDQFTNWFNQKIGDEFSFFNAFTGGSFERMSILALNITPYITSSIIMQLLTIAIPKLEEMQKEDCFYHPLCDGCACFDRVNSYGCHFLERKPFE